MSYFNVRTNTDENYIANLITIILWYLFIKRSEESKQRIEMLI